MVNATENDVFNRRYELLLCGTLDIEVCYFLEFANMAHPDLTIMYINNVATA